MTSTTKQLIFLLLIGFAVFTFAKSIALKFMAQEDYSRRFKIWAALTIVAFLTLNFWLFTLVAVPVYLWAQRKDSNPIALYLFLMHVVPPVEVDIPVVGINQLFALSNYRLLAFCVLVPVAMRVRRSPAGRLGIMDYLLLLYGLLQVWLYIPPDLPNNVILPDSFTNVLRRALLFFIDTYALFYAVSRSLTTKKSIIEAIAAYCLGTLVLSGVAAYENLRHWLLYADLSLDWNPQIPAWSFYITRDNSVRAAASAGYSLALGYLIAVGFGVWLYLARAVDSRLRRLGVTAMLWMGLVCAYARGPWLGAVAIYLAFAAFSRSAAKRVTKALLIGTAALAILAMTPLGERIFSVLPMFGGSIDSGNVVYREKLRARAWELIQASPFFGDQMPFSKMNDLRQGQGIIDLVNSYINVALFYGLVGLSLFAAFILIGFWKSYRASRSTLNSDPDLGELGACICACIVGTLIMIENSSFALGYEKMFYVLGALALGYSYCVQATATAGSRARPAAARQRGA